MLSSTEERMMQGAAVLSAREESFWRNCGVIRPARAER